MNITLPSGRWAGFYRYSWLLLWRKGSMDLHLNFAGGIISGHGTDPEGSFTIVGHYELDYQFTKQYAGKHSVLYKGRPKGRGLAGRWQISDNWGGDFDIWPTE